MLTERKLLMKYIVLLICVFQSITVLSFQTISSDSTKAKELEQRADKINFDNPDSALKLFNSALAFTDTSIVSERKATLLNKIAYTHYVLGQYDLSLSFFLNALSTNEQLKNNGGISRGYSGIGLIYEAQGKYDLAINQLLKAISFATKAKDTVRLTSAYLNLSISYDSKGLYDSAMSYSLKSLDLAQRYSNHRLVDMAYNRMGVILFHQKKYNESIQSFQKSLDYTAYQDNWEESFTYAGLAKSYAALGKLDLSIKAGQRSFELGKELNAWWDMMEISETLSQVYAMKGNYKEAYEMQRLFKIYSDSVFDDKREQEINFLHLQQNEIEKKRLQQENELQQVKLNQKNIVVASSIGAGILLLVIAFVLYRSNQQRKVLNDELILRNKNIAERNAKIEEQNESLVIMNQTKSQLLSIIGHDMRNPIHNIELILQMVEEKQISEEERNEIFKDLHRSISSVAETMDNLLAWASSQLNGIKTEPVNAYLDVVIASQLIFWNSPAEKKNIRIIHHKQPEIAVKADVNHLKTVIRNIVGNSIKFTREGGQVVIDYIKNENEIGINIADTGTGIAPEKLQSLFSFQSKHESVGTANEKGTGLGLMLSKEFVEKNNGRIEVRSELGKGSSFTIWLPRMK